MADDIIQFAPGGKVTAEETNENNLLLKEWALDNSASETYIDGKIATLTSNLNSQISSINTQMASKANIANPTFTGTVKVPNSATVGTAISTAAITKADNGYVKFGNGVIVQWGAFTGGNKKAVTYPTAFSSYARIAFASMQGSDNSRICCTAVNSSSKTGFTATTINTNGGGSDVQNVTVYFVAVGY